MFFKLSLYQRFTCDALFPLLLGTPLAFILLMSRQKGRKHAYCGEQTDENQVEQGEKINLKMDVLLEILSCIFLLLHYPTLFCCQSWTTFLRLRNKNTSHFVFFFAGLVITCHMFVQLATLSLALQVKWSQTTTKRVEEAPRWWSEVYSLPHKRHNVHNNLEPRVLCFTVSLCRKFLLLFCNEKVWGWMVPGS